MNKSDLSKAVSDAKAFINAAAKLKNSDLNGYREGQIWNPKLTGAIKRRSMDLTRSLADLRHPWRDRK